MTQISKTNLISPSFHTETNKGMLEKAAIDEVMDALIKCSRISISLGWQCVSSKIYQAEYELEKIMEQSAAGSERRI